MTQKKIDAHIHFGTDPHVASKTVVPYLRPDHPDSTVQYLEEQNADLGVLFPHDRVFTPPWDADYNRQNEQVGTAVNAHPDRLIGVARINPTFSAPHTPPTCWTGMSSLGTAEESSWWPASTSIAPTTCR